ncbi:MAG TPA: class I SAM-dependent methyltransferase [Candidatus Hydrogenedentes bacterium]|nr:class I SAM-dependent methyltransferase [Candidatus Hydrogenedentota bacterium]
MVKKVCDMSMDTGPNTVNQIYWNHNNHYYGFLLSHVPVDCDAALDIGCGTGEFAGRLCAICKSVDAIDSDSMAIETARHFFAKYANITFQCKKFGECELPHNYYDYISLIASLHHMDSRRSLEYAKNILKPGGILAILGLYKETAVFDYLHSLAAVPIDFMYRVVKHSSISESTETMVIIPPEETLKQIRAMMNEILPRHVFRRHLFWRYSVLWKKPEG